MNAPNRSNHLKTVQPPVIAGRLPPHDLGAETAVIATILVKSEAMDDVASLIAPTDFYSPALGSLYEAMLELRRLGEPIDAAKVAGWLRDRERLAQVGGAPFITQIMNDDAGSMHFVVSHARAVAMKARRRRVIAEAQAIAAEGYGDVGDETAWIEDVEQRVGRLAQAGSTTVSVTMKDAITEYWRTWQDETSGNTPLAGGRFGIRDLDRLTGPLRQGMFVVVGGWPGDGKTSLGLQAAIATAEERGAKPAASLVISAEMTDEELAMRALFSRARVDSTKAAPYRHKEITHEMWANLTRSATELGNLPVWIDDRSNLNIGDVGPSIRRHKSLAKRLGFELRLVVVDYLQLISGATNLARGSSREQMVNSVAEGLKNAAKGCEVAIVALAQLNDDAAKRKADDQRPRASDFRESKGIWAHSDKCILINNPMARERSRAKQNGDRVAASSDNEEVELIVDKNRGGKVGTVDALFLPHLTRFEDLARGQEEGF